MGRVSSNGGKDGVSASQSTEKTGRDDSGRWLPGVSGNPRGRPGKAWEEANINAMASAFSPEEKQQFLRQAVQLAIAQQSPRGIVAVLSYIDDRVGGKPVQRVQQESGGLASVLEELGLDGE